MAKQLGNAIKAEQNGSVALFYINKNKAAGLLQKTGPQLPRILFPNNGSIHSIREPGSKVKPKFGNVTQSQQFKRWFGDWEKNPKTASKVVNDDGTPKIVYHGTDSNFTVFNTNKTRSNMDIKGSFFSPWEIDAQGYGEKVGAYYLSIKNSADEGTAYKALNRFAGQEDAGTKARDFLIQLGYGNNKIESVGYDAQPICYC